MAEVAGLAVQHLQHQQAVGGPVLRVLAEMPLAQLLERQVQMVGKQAFPAGAAKVTLT
jgi:hypothetical protein